MGGGAYLSKPYSLATGSTGIICTGLHPGPTKKPSLMGTTRSSQVGCPRDLLSLPLRRQGRQLHPKQLPCHGALPSAYKTTGLVTWVLHTREGLEYSAPWPWMFDLYSQGHITTLQDRGVITAGKGILPCAWHKQNPRPLTCHTQRLLILSLQKAANH